MEASSTTSKEENKKFEEANFDIPKLPELNVDRDFAIAKRYLQKLGEGNESLWDHLVELIRYVLDNRPPNCMKHFEALSRSLRLKKFSMEDTFFRAVHSAPINLFECMNNIKLYSNVEKISRSENKYIDETVTDSKMIFNFRLLSESGIGIPTNELYNIYMSLRLLGKKENLSKVRFWGKIFGIDNNYIIAECELLPEALSEKIAIYETEKKKELMLKLGTKAEKKVRILEEPIEVIFGSMQKRVLEDIKKAPQMNQEKLLMVEEEGGESVVEKPKTKFDSYIKPPLPPLPIIEEITVPQEPPGSGVNKMVYYVINKPGDDWECLPDISPRQIVIGRQIKKFFTGHLDAEIICFPDFPGKERELLRVQIARISATSQVSPVGFYEGENEEEGGITLQEGELYTENLDYEPLPIRELLDPSLEFWAHHTQFILKQGRTNYWTPPSQKQTGEFEGEDEFPEPEIAPRILRALSQDNLLETGDSAWSLRPTSLLLKDASAVTIRSHLWPGAISVTKGKSLQFIYVGWGFKSFDLGYSPALYGSIWKEYETGPEIMEMNDPTAEMEKEVWRKQQERKMMKELATRVGEEGEGEIE